MDPPISAQSISGWLRRKKEDHGMFEDPYKTVGGGLLHVVCIVDEKIIAKFGFLSQAPLSQHMRSFH